MTKPYQEQQAEPFFLTEDVAAEIVAAGYEFKPPSRARTRPRPVRMAARRNAGRGHCPAPEQAAFILLTEHGIFHGINRGLIIKSL
ncbi:hypothetical protein [Pseudomonas sp.]|uniref:hypothetical protein n=1 Tax=Pseudomonas sp. TaxID=306 RepID=UPI003D0EEE84